MLITLEARISAQFLLNSIDTSWSKRKKCCTVNIIHHTHLNWVPALYTMCSYKYCWTTIDEDEYNMNENIPRENFFLMFVAFLTEIHA